jgi:hypothetical protein
MRVFQDFKINETRRTVQSIFHECILPLVGNGERQHRLSSLGLGGVQLPAGVDCRMRGFIPASGTDYGLSASIVAVLGLQQLRPEKYG